MATALERRAFPRFPRADIGVMVLDPLLERVVDPAPRICDIGEGGVCLQTRAPVLPGETIRLRMTLPDGSMLQATARVRWAIDGAPLERRCGVQFAGFAAGAAPLRRLLGRGDARTAAGRTLDLALAAACALVAVFVMRGLAGRPDLVREASGLLGDSLPQLLVIGGALLGITLCLGR